MRALVNFVYMFTIWGGIMYGLIMLARYIVPMIAPELDMFYIGAIAGVAWGALWLWVFDG